jgi:MFS family permease
MSEPATARNHPARLHRNHNYLWWLASDTGTAFGTALQSFAIPLLALYVTGSPAQAGIVAAIGQVGRVVAILPGGVLADRHDRRMLMLAGGALGLAVAGAMAGLQVAGLLDVWLLAGLNLLLNIRNGLFGSVSNAALKDVVSTPQIAPAMAANQGRDAAVSLAGGPAGGGLMALGHALPLAAVAASHAVALVGALAIKADLRPRPDGATAAPLGDAATPRHSSAAAMVRGYVGEATEGLKWIFRRPELRGVMLISTVLNLGVNSAVTSVVFGLQQRGESPAAIGLVSAALGAGILLGSLVAPLLVKRVRTGTLAVCGLLLVAGGVAFLPFVPELPGLLAVLALMVFAAPSINAGLLGYFMAAVPSPLLGRASSAMDLLALGAVPLAPLIAGFGYAVLGWSGVLLVCAGLCAAAALLAAANRRLRSLPGPGDWEDHAAEMSAEAAATVRI